MPVTLHFESDEKFGNFSSKLQGSGTQVLYEQYRHDAQAGIRSYMRSQGALGSIESRMKTSWKKKEYSHYFMWFSVGPSLQHYETVYCPSVSGDAPGQSPLPPWITEMQTDVTPYQLTFATLRNSFSLTTGPGNAATTNLGNPILNIASSAVNHNYHSSHVSDGHQPNCILPCQTFQPIPIKHPLDHTEQHPFDSSPISSLEWCAKSPSFLKETSGAEQQEPVSIIPKKGNASIDIKAPHEEPSRHHVSGTSRNSGTEMAPSNILSKKYARNISRAQQRATQDGSCSSTPAKAGSSTTFSLVGDSAGDDMESPRKPADQGCAGARPLEATLADRPIDQLALPRTRAKANQGNPAPVTPVKPHKGCSTSAAVTPTGSGETLIRKAPSHRTGSDMVGSNYRKPSRNSSSVFDQPLATLSPVEAQSQRLQRQRYTDRTAEFLADPNTTSLNVEPAHVRQDLSYADSVKGLQQSQPQRRSELESSTAVPEKIVHGRISAESECNGLNGTLSSPSTQNGSLSSQERAGVQPQHTPQESEDEASPPSLSRRQPPLTLHPPPMRYASPGNPESSDTLSTQGRRPQSQGTTQLGSPDPFIRSPAEDGCSFRGLNNVDSSVACPTDVQGARAAFLPEQLQHDSQTPVSYSTPSSSTILSTNDTPATPTPAGMPDENLMEAQRYLLSPDGPFNEVQRNLFLHNPHRSRYEVTQQYNAFRHTLPLQERSKRPDWTLDPRTRYQGLDPARLPHLSGRAAARGEEYARAIYGCTLDEARNLGPVQRHREGNVSGAPRP
ncbi:MAG: hypothetical protein Q9220_006892 [cf. Caloplaca sp. 1 TL-2023]